MNEPTIETIHSPINRVIAAPKSELERFVSDAGFRTDSYFCSRLNVAPVSGTPMQQNGQTHNFTVDANPRVFTNSRMQAVGFTTVAAPEAPAEVNGPTVSTVQTLAETPANQAHCTLVGDRAPQVVGLTMAKLEKLAIIQTLEHCAGNRTRAARMLGLSVRTLQRKLNSWNLKGL